MESSAVLKGLSGVDIQRKSTLRKAKFLFSLPGNLASTKGGKIGEISGMDTPNPVIHLDFPHVSIPEVSSHPSRSVQQLQGRLRLQGTVLKPPTTKYMTLVCSKSSKAGSAGSVVCEDIFTAVVVFSTATWEASEELPVEQRGAGGLPIDILEAMFPSKTFASTCSRPAKPSSDPSVSQSQSLSQSRDAAGSSSQASEQPSQEYRTSSGRRARRTAASMAEEALADNISSAGGSDSDTTAGGHGDSDSQAEEVMVKRVCLFGGAEASGSSAPAASSGANQTSTVWGTLSDFDSDDDGLKPSTSKARSKRSTAVSVSSTDQDGSDSGVVDLIRSESDAGDSHGDGASDSASEGELQELSRKSGRKGGAKRPRVPPPSTARSTTKKSKAPRRGAAQSSTRQAAAGRKRTDSDSSAASPGEDSVEMSSDEEWP